MKIEGMTCGQAWGVFWGTRQSSCGAQLWAAAALFRAALFTALSSEQRKIC